MANWWPAIGFALFSALSALMGALRHRDLWPLTKHAPSAPPPFDTPLFGPPSIWHAGALRALDGAAFGALCEAMFRQDGCSTEPAVAAAHNFMLRRRDSEPPTRSIVHCEPWSVRPVGEMALRSFAAAIGRSRGESNAASRAEACIFIAAGTVDSAASACARQHAITLVDGPALLKLIVQRSERQQRALREIATPQAEAPPARLALEPTPAPMWFAAASVAALAAWMSWPAPREMRPIEAADDTPAHLLATDLPTARAHTESQRPPRPTPATAADLDPAPITVLPPAAGRQILRCIVEGHVSYLAADAACPQGQGERITVFPTEGVNPLR